MFVAFADTAASPREGSLLAEVFKSFRFHIPNDPAKTLQLSQARPVVA
ncbi:hypothetical protein [Phaeobacter sp. B1627]|nr:hypothetical protein [Phaeobacter sp. B1627]